MATEPNTPLVVAAAFSAVAALLHVGIVIGGAQWYRFFGAGERMALASAAGRMYPSVVTLGIATVLALWSATRLCPLPINALLSVELLDLHRLWGGPSAGPQPGLDP